MTLKIKPMAEMSVPSLMALGEEMRHVADQYPLKLRQMYSNNETEVMENTLEWSKNPDEDGRTPEWLWEIGLSRAVQFEANSIISLCISREEFENPPIYRLSMCRVTRGSAKMAPVPDLEAAMAAACVLGPGTERVPNPSGIENSKHFIRRIGLANDGQNRK